MFTIKDALTLIFFVVGWLVFVTLGIATVLWLTANSLLPFFDVIIPATYWQCVGVSVASMILYFVFGGEWGKRSG